MTEEVWKAVVGYEGLYEVSDHGRVRACEKRTIANQLRSARMLKQHWVQGQSVGYLRIALRRPGQRQRKHLVHVLVLEAFHGPRKPGMQARHYPDHDTNNNRATNLSWATAKTNVEDQVERGTFRSVMRKKKYDDGEVERIRDLLPFFARAYGRHKQIANWLGLPVHLVCDVALGRR